MDFTSNEQEHVVATVVETQEQIPVITTLIESQEQSYEPFIPHDETSKIAQKLAIELDKPIMLDYYRSSISGLCKMKKTSKNNKILVKCRNVYTAPIIKVIEVNKSRNVRGQGTSDLICETECSIYIVSNLVIRPNQL